MPETITKGIGGWIKDAGALRGNCLLQDIDPAEFNPDHLAYFQDYRTRYFNDRLVPNQGVEEILGMLRDHGGSPSHWIDLGAGVTTLFWAIGVKSPGAITVCDLVPEALQVLSDFKASGELPPCYRQALTLVGRSHAEFERTRNLDWDFRVLDCLQPWTTDGAGAGYDLITAIGCFGLSPNTAAYSEAFQHAARNLAPSGRMIGADWVRSKKFIDIEGHDNRYIDRKLIEGSARNAGLKTLGMQAVTIEGDPYYDAVIVWAYGR